MNFVEITDGGYGIDYIQETILIISKYAFLSEGLHIS